ncbi:hypothetical protein FRC00_010829 [Tulasnella sp. 408]|nr:hypothetical protein FRC00_010829 [Tulasnella sp. 408]
MDPEASAAMQDLIRLLDYRMKARDLRSELEARLTRNDRANTNFSLPTIHGSVEQEDLRSTEPKQSSDPFSALALAPNSVLQRVHSEIDTAIAAVREQANARLPVSRLPMELFTSIFQMASERSHSSNDKGRLLANLLLVCRMWNRVVLDSPELWTEWNSSDGPQFFKRALAQSRSLGLTLSCNLEPYEPVGHQELGQCMSRRQDVTLYLGWRGDEVFAKLQKLGKDTAPKLQKLSIRSERDHDPLDIFDPSNPCPLEKLEIDRTAIAWGSVNFERLRYLHISDIKTGYGAPSEMELLKILERSQRLEYLCIKETCLSEELTELPVPNQPVCLPRLSYCEISCWRTAETLIRMIRFPSCKEIVVDGLWISGPDVISSLAHIVHALENAIRATDTTLAITDDVFLVETAGTRRPGLSMIGGPEAVVSWFVNLAHAALNASPSVDVVLASNFSYDWTMRTIAELGNLRSITILRFKGGRPFDSHCNPLTCLDNLGDQIQHTFPLLSTLQCCINTVSELESLRRVVLRRHQAIASQEQESISPLREVIITLDDDWGLHVHCNYHLDEIQALIVGAHETVLEEVQNECDEAIVAAREQYNARLPVNTLPPELLSYTFQLGPEDYKCRSVARLSSMEQGRSQFTEFVDAVVRNDGPEHFERGRILSKSMGLSLYSRHSDDDMLYLLIAEVGRWQDVMIDFSGGTNHWLDHLGRLGSQNAPKLRKLDLSAGWLGGPGRVVLNLFNPHDPCGLEDLALVDVPMVWDGLKFQHLRRLRISEIYEMAPSLAEMLWIFERNPRLEYLWLSDMEIGPANLELSGISQPILMDFLSYLNLDIYKRDGLGGLVRMMRFPNCRQIKLRPITAPDPDSVYSLTHLFEAARHSIAVTETKVSVDYCTLEICAGGGPEIEIDIEDEPQLALSEFIKVSIAALAASPAVTLILKENFSYKWTMQVISALAPLRSITALKFLG